MHLRIVFQRLKENGLRLNPFKCILEVPEVTFLGQRINSKGTFPLPEKVQAVKYFS